MGFLVILANALIYVLGWDGAYTPLMITGLVMVVTGINLSRTSTIPARQHRAS